MKKFTLVMLLFLIVGCFAVKETKDSLILEKSGYKSILTFYHKKDKVTKQEAENTVYYSYFNLKNKKQVQEALAGKLTPVQNVKGITHDITYYDLYMVEKVSVDYTQVDPTQTKNLPGFVSQGDLKNGVSFSESVKLAEKQGYKKQ